MHPLDCLVVIGSFEPFHNGHLAALEAGLGQAQRLLVLIGSARAARSIRHPWTAAERSQMISDSLPGPHADRVMLGTVRDHLYRDAQWLRAVQVAVEDVLPQATSLRVGIAAGPETGDWSPSFPHWTRARHPHASCPAAAELRHGLFQTPPDQPLPQSLAAAVPAGTLKFLQDFRRSQHFPALQAEFHAIERDRQAWRAAPYPPVFVTTDAVVLCSGHILLVQRGHHPGKGLWALPGGFVDQQERLLAGCLRELLEETSLRVEPAALRAQQVFDAPDRSMRGRTITHAFHFDLGDGTLPAVSGGDDASRAAWLPLAQFFRMEHELFEDHFHIVDSFLGGS